MRRSRPPANAWPRRPTLVLLATFALGAATAGCASHAPGTSRSMTHDRPTPEPVPLVDYSDTHSDTPSTPGDATLEHALRAHFQDWRGVPYRYGGRDRNGIDCSSFVRQTMSAVDSLKLPRTTAQQVQRGETIPRSNLAPGDLVFFRTGRSSRHVGIYVGSGRFMHASSSKGVTISRLDNIYWRQHYWQSRRVISANN